MNRGRITPVYTVHCGGCNVARTPADGCAQETAGDVAKTEGWVPADRDRAMEWEADIEAARDAT